MKRKLAALVLASAIPLSTLSGCEGKVEGTTSKEISVEENQSAFDMSARDVVNSVIKQAGRNPSNLPAPIENNTASMKSVSVTVSDGIDVQAFAKDGLTNSAYVIMDGANANADTDTFLEYGRAMFDLLGCGDKFKSASSEWQDAGEYRYALYTDNTSFKIMYIIEKK